MNKANILIWEALPFIGGGQKMSLIVADVLKETYNILFTIPATGELSVALEKRRIPYEIVPSPKLALGKKAISDIVSYFFTSRAQINAIANLIRERNIQLLYVPGPALMPLGAVIGKKVGVSVVWHIHHIFSDRKARLLLSLASRNRFVKKIITVSDVAGRQICFRRGRKKLVTIYNPINLAPYDTAHGREAVMSELGITKGDFAIAQIGFIQEQKNQLLTICAVHSLVRQGYKNTKLFIVGEARPEDASYKEKLLSYVEENGLEQNVFFTGYRNDVPNVLAAVAAVAVVMSVEGFSLAALEGMASRLPVVAIDTGGVAEIVRKADAGILFDAAKERVLQSYEAALLRLMDSPDERKRFGENGHRFAEQNNFAVFSQKLRAVFAEVLVGTDGGNV